MGAAWKPNVLCCSPSVHEFAKTGKTSKFNGNNNWNNKDEKTSPEFSHTVDSTVDGAQDKQARISTTSHCVKACDAVQYMKNHHKVKDTIVARRPIRYTESKKHILQANAKLESALDQPSNWFNKSFPCLITIRRTILMLLMLPRKIPGHETTAVGHHATSAPRCGRLSLCSCRSAQPASAPPLLVRSNTRSRTPTLRADPHPPFTPNPEQPPVGAGGWSDSPANSPKGRANLFFFPALPIEYETLSVNNLKFERIETRIEYRSFTGIFFCSLLLRCDLLAKKVPGRAPYSQHIMIRNWT